MPKPPKPAARSQAARPAPKAAPTSAAKAPGRTPAAWANKGPGRAYPCKSKYIDKTLPMRGRKATVEACATPSREAPREGRFRVGYDTGGHANVPRSAVHRAAYRAKHPKPPIDPACPPWRKGCGGATGRVEERAALAALAAEMAAFEPLKDGTARARALWSRLDALTTELNAADGPLRPADRTRVREELASLRRDAALFAVSDAAKHAVDKRRAALRSLAQVTAEHPAFTGDGRRARAFRATLKPLHDELHRADGPLTEARYRTLHAALDTLVGHLPQVDPAAPKAARAKDRPAAKSAAPAAPPRKVDAERAALRGRVVDLARHPGLSGDDARATAMQARLTGIRAELLLSDGPLPNAVLARLDAAIRGLLSDAARHETAKNADPDERRGRQPRWRDEVDPARMNMRVTADAIGDSAALKGDTPRAVALRERLHAIRTVLEDGPGPIAAGPRKALEAKLAALWRAVKEHDDARAAAAKAADAALGGNRREYSRTTYKALARVTEGLGIRMPALGLSAEGFARYAANMIVLGLERECYGTKWDSTIHGKRPLCHFERKVTVTREGDVTIASVEAARAPRGSDGYQVQFRSDGSVWHFSPGRGENTPKDRKAGRYVAPSLSPRPKVTHIVELESLADDISYKVRQSGPVFGVPDAEPRRAAPGALEAAFSVDAVSSATLRKLLAGGGSVKGRRVTLVGNATGQSVRVLVDREGAQLDVTVPAKVAKPGEVILDAPVFATALKTGFSVRPNAGAFGVFNGSAKLGDAHLRGNTRAPAAGSTVGRDLARLGPQALAAMARVLPMSSTDDTRPHLASVLLDGPSGIAVTTDGHRLCTSPLGQTFPGVLLVPRDAVEWLLALAQNFKAPSVELKHVAGRLDLLFAVGTARLHAEMTKHPYPSYKQVIPSNVEGTVVVKRREMIAGLEDAAKKKKFPDRTYGVRLHFPKRKMSAENPNTDDDKLTYWEAPIPVVRSSGTVVETIGFNAAYILDALKAAQGDTVTFGISGELDPATITDDASGTLSVCMPMRV